MNYQTPLARVRGLGSARQGSQDWWRQRVTAVALLPLSLWLAAYLSILPDVTYAEVVRWISLPWKTILLLSFILLSLFHAMLGLQVVIEDYVHNDWMKIIGMLGVRLVTAFLALSTVFSVLRIVFLGGHG
jgi:succinate dehydrogenase / fumarate reductase membrane anchor subunit